MEFKAFDDIKCLDSRIVITEKIHGTNSQVAIDDLGVQMKAGSRTRWLTAEDDNYGFAKWALPQKDALIKLLGPGRHFGEWYGQGIGPGYNLKEKRFALFNTFRWNPLRDSGSLLPQMDVVPVLYEGVFTPTIVDETMEKLLKSGSIISPGYMKPEGVVIYFSAPGIFLKKVFEKEETKWDEKDKKPKPAVDLVFEAKVDSYLHPIRLEKLMMKESRLLENYPKSLPDIVTAYMDDLVKECSPIETGVLSAVRTKVFKMIRTTYGK